MTTVFAVFQNATKDSGITVFNTTQPRNTFYPIPDGPLTDFFGDGKSWFTWNTSTSQPQLSFTNPNSPSNPFYIEVTFSGTVNVQLVPVTGNKKAAVHIILEIIDEQNNVIDLTSYAQDPLPYPNISLQLINPVYMKRTYTVVPGVTKLSLKISVGGDTISSLSSTFVYSARVLGQQSSK